MGEIATISTDPPIEALRLRARSEWTLPIGLLAASFAFMAIDHLLQLLNAFGDAAAEAPDFSYAGNSATIVGWLLATVAALLADHTLGRSRWAKPVKTLVRMSAIGAALLAIAAGLTLAIEVVLRSHLGDGLHYASLVDALERANLGATTAAWSAVATGVAIALVNAWRGAEDARLLGHESRASLGFTMVAALLNLVAFAIYFVVSWIPSDFGLGLFEVLYGLFAAAWLALSGALLAAFVAARRSSHGRQLLGLPVGAVGPLLLAAGTVFSINLYVMFFARDDLQMIIRWEDGLFATGWIMLAVGIALLAPGIRNVAPMDEELPVA